MTTPTTTRNYLHILWPFALNLVSLLCLGYAIYLAIKIHEKPLLAWDVPLHLSYQNNRDAGNVRVRHSRDLARYDAGLWNSAVQICGGLVAAITLVAFRYRRSPVRGTGTGDGRILSDGILSSSPSSSAASVSARLRTKRLTLNTVMLWIATIAFGAQICLNLFGMHPSTWTMTSPIGPVSTAAITEELGFGAWVPAAAPWDLSAVMLRSAFEHVVSQKGPGALEITHRHLSHHLQETLDGAGVRIGRTVYPSIRTHGVGVAPAPWERKGYRLPSAAAGRVLGYKPVVAGTNVTVQCRDTTEDWSWGHNVVEVSFSSSSSSSEDERVVVHRFDLAPKADWQTRGPNRTVTFVEGEGTRSFYFDTWQALKKIKESGDHIDSAAGTEDAADDQENADRDDNNRQESGSESTTNDEPTVHQLFFFPKFTLHHPVSTASDPTVTVTFIDCQYGGRDVIRQVSMTAPTEPVSIGPVLATKDELTFDELIPMASAIDEALNDAGGRGGAMVAGMAAGKMTSLEVWEMFLGRTLSLPELIEHIITDTAQAYYSLVRQWREEALFLSWRKDKDLPEGHLTVMTNKQVGGGGGGGVWFFLLVMLGLLAVAQLWGLMSFTRSLVDGRVARSLSEQGLELRDGVITRVKKKDE